MCWRLSTPEGAACQASFYRKFKHLGENGFTFSGLERDKSLSPDAPGKFYSVVKERVEAYLATKHKSPRAGWLLLIKAVILVSLVVGSYTAALVIGEGWILIPLGVVFAVSALLLAINVGHDASHDAVFCSPILNLILQRACFLLTGINGYLWRMRHLNSHHLFPNVNGSDTDIDENPYNFSITGVVNAPAVPEATVLGNSVVIADGDTTPSTTDGTDFGTVAQGGAAIRRPQPD